jgi:AcrR family transcriptional regulator
LVAAATEAIADLGLANVRVADVAERAGVGPGHVTYYFPSKDELLMKAIRQSEEAFHAEIASHIHLIDDPWERLRRLIELAIPDGPHDPGWVLWLDVMAAAASSRAVAEGGAELERWWREELANVLRYGREQGVFEVGNLDESVMTLSSLIDGLSIRLTLGAREITRDMVLERAMACAREWLLAPRAAG